jgi:hypothetical protein
VVLRRAVAAVTLVHLFNFPINTLFYYRIRDNNRIIEIIGNILNIR